MDKANGYLAKSEKKSKGGQLSYFLYYCNNLFQTQKNILGFFFSLFTNGFLQLYFSPQTQTVFCLN
jgi:hypothetical protein